MRAIAYLTSLAFAGLFVMASRDGMAQVPPGGVPIPTASDFGDPGDQFGSDIGVEGNWLVTTGFNLEAFYVYERVGTLWLRRQRIVTPTLGQTGPMTIHLRNNRLLLSRGFGTIDDPAGHVYIYERSAPGADFAYVATIRPTDSQSGDRFGYGLAQSSDRIFVGASGRDEGANVDQGAAYVFRLDSGNWVQEAKLIMSDPTVNDRFAFSLDFDGQDLLIGARQNRPSVPAPNQRGAVYVYRFITGNWTMVQKLVPPAGVTTGTQMGYALQAENGRAVITAPSSPSRALHYATRDGGGIWSYINLPDPTAGSGLTANFLNFPDLEGDTAAVGVTTFRGGGAPGPGLATTYFFNGSTWSIASQIQRPDGDGAAAAAVRITDGHLLVGAPLDDASAKAFDQGSILSFSLNNGVTTPRQRIWHGVGNVPDYLGEEVAISGDWALVTAEGADMPVAGGTDLGEAYFLKRTGATWNFVQSAGSTVDTDTPQGVQLFNDLAFIAYTQNETAGLGNPIVRVLKRHVSDQWLPHCDLQPPSGAGFDNLIAVSASGLLITVRDGTGRQRIAAYPLPIATCGPGTYLADPPGTNPSSVDVALKGAVAVVTSSISNQLQASVYEFNGSNWVLGQTFIGTAVIGLSREMYSAGDSDGGNRLALVHAVPISSIDARYDVTLYERPDATSPFTLVRTITPPPGLIGYRFARMIGTSIFTADITQGQDQALSFFSFATGAALQSVGPSGLSIEDGPIESLAFDGTHGIIGFPNLNRLGVNHAGLVYSLSLGATRGGVSTWQIEPIADVPSPDRMFFDGMEAQNY